MLKVQEKFDLKNSTRVINGTWEVNLTDPSASFNSFGSPLINKYIMTELISPYGQKIVLYNTAPKNTHDNVFIDLSLEGINDGGITDLQIRASDSFYNKWNLYLVDHRNSEVQNIIKDNDIKVEPPIQFDKFSGLGFVSEKKQVSNKLFELKLSLK